MTGGIGNDAYYVDNAGDQVIEAVGSGSDNVFASVDYTLAAGQEVEFLRASSAEPLPTDPPPSDASQSVSRKVWSVITS